MTENIRIKIINKSDALPSYETTASAGMDLRAHIDAPICCKPLERIIVKPVCLLNCPSDMKHKFVPSGLAAKGITVANAPGTIDADYRGEIE